MGCRVRLYASWALLLTQSVQGSKEYALLFIVVIEVSGHSKHSHCFHELGDVISVLLARIAGYLWDTYCGGC